MAKHPTGGYAFPDAEFYGMSLCDYFAAKAMQSLVANDAEQDKSPKSIAIQAYRLANAMMEQKEFQDGK